WMWQLAELRLRRSNQSGNDNPNTHDPAAARGARLRTRQRPAHSELSCSTLNFGAQGFSQLSTERPGTRRNSPSLFVTTVAEIWRACDAMSMSYGPIGFPLDNSAVLISAKSLAAPHGRSSNSNRSKRSSSAASFSLRNSPLAAPNLSSDTVIADSRSSPGERPDMRRAMRS